MRPTRLPAPAAWPGCAVTAGPPPQTGAERCWRLPGRGRCASEHVHHNRSLATGTHGARGWQLPCCGWGPHAGPCGCTARSARAHTPRPGARKGTPPARPTFLLQLPDASLGLSQPASSLLLSCRKAPAPLPVGCRLVLQARLCQVAVGRSLLCRGLSSCLRGQQLRLQLLRSEWHRAHAHLLASLPSRST